MNVLRATLSAALCFAVVCSATANAQESVPTPQLFAPGVISRPGSDGSPAFFTPDGKTLFFTEENATWSVIMESHRVGTTWSAPQIAPFSGRWSDGYPAISPDGSFIVFVSQRPHVSALYRVTRTASGWSDPVRLPNTVNISNAVWRSSIASDGTIYFMAFASISGPPRLYSSRLLNGAYQQAQPVSFSTDTTRDVDPQISPDQSFFIFSSSGRSAKGDTLEHLYIAHRQGLDWGPVTRVRYVNDDRPPSTDNEPTLSPDTHTLYFASDRTMPVHFPRTRAQAEHDVARMAGWDNGNTNIWFIPLNSP